MENVSGTDQILNDGSAVGWGGNLTTGINLENRAVLRLQEYTAKEWKII